MKGDIEDTNNKCNSLCKGRIEVFFSFPSLESHNKFISIPKDTTKRIEMVLNTIIEY